MVFHTCANECGCEYFDDCAELCVTYINGDTREGTFCLTCTEGTYATCCPLVENATAHSPLQPMVIALQLKRPSPSDVMSVSPFPRDICNVIIEYYCPVVDYEILHTMNPSITNRLLGLLYQCSKARIMCEQDHVTEWLPVCEFYANLPKYVQEWISPYHIEEWYQWFQPSPFDPLSNVYKDQLVENIVSLTNKRKNYEFWIQELDKTISNKKQQIKEWDASSHQRIENANWVQWNT